VAFVAEIVIVGVFAVDLAEKWSEDALPGIRVLAVVAAAVFAGAVYIHWETAATHGAAALGLLGGGLIAASVFSAGLDVVFKNVPFASIGVTAVVVSYVLGQLSIFAQDKKS